MVSRYDYREKKTSTQVIYVIKIFSNNKVVIRNRYHLIKICKGNNNINNNSVRQRIPNFDILEFDVVVSRNENKNINYNRNNHNVPDVNIPDVNITKYKQIRTNNKTSE